MLAVSLGCQEGRASTGSVCMGTAKAGPKAPHLWCLHGGPKRSVSMRLGALSRVRILPVGRCAWWAARAAASSQKSAATPAPFPRASSVSRIPPSFIAWQHPAAWGRERAREAATWCSRSRSRLAASVASHAACCGGPSRARGASSPGAPPANCDYTRWEKGR